jgi:predicted RNA polymerase sigma factor
VLGAVIRRFREFAAAEDAVQEALVAAATQWPRDGVPGNPRGWLIQVASRRLADHRRSELARHRREARSAAEAELVAPRAETGEDAGQDDSLVLLFMCCHPALSTASAIALTLRAVGGLTTGEIAHAFLVRRPAADQPRQAEHQASGYPSTCPPARNGSSGWARCSTCSI